MLRRYSSFVLIEDLSDYSRLEKFPLSNHMSCAVLLEG